jgi:hypothetical protein
MISSRSTESSPEVQARIGVILLSGNTVSEIIATIVAALRRVEVSFLESELRRISQWVIAPLIQQPKDGYVWVLNIYRRGIEVMYEIGECPKSKMDSLATLEDTHFLAPEKFCAWEMKQQEERRRHTRGIALRDFCKKKDDDSPYAMACGIHLAYIIDKPWENHVSAMKPDAKRMYYFRELPSKPKSPYVKHRTEYCPMTAEQYGAVGNLLRIISNAIGIRDTGHISTAVTWISTVERDWSALRR